VQSVRTRRGEAVDHLAGGATCRKGDEGGVCVHQSVLRFIAIAGLFLVSFFTVQGERKEEEVKKGKRTRTTPSPRTKSMSALRLTVCSSC
jgi:hypothetical protein